MLINQQRRRPILLSCHFPGITTAIWLFSFNSAEVVPEMLPSPALLQHFPLNNGILLF